MKDLHTSHEHSRGGSQAVKRMKRPRTQKTASEGKTLVMSSLFGMFWGYLLLFPLFCIFGAVCLCFGDPLSFITPICLFSVYAASFFCGMIAVKHEKCPPLTCGLLSGSLFMLSLKLILLILGLLLRSSPISGGRRLILTLLIIPSALFGAFLAPRHSGRNSAGRRKMRR